MNVKKQLLNIKTKIQLLEKEIVTNKKNTSSWVYNMFKNVGEGIGIFEDEIMNLVKILRGSTGIDFSKISKKISNDTRFKSAVRNYFNKNESSLNNMIPEFLYVVTPYVKTITGNDKQIPIEALNQSLVKYQTILDKEITKREKDGTRQSKILVTKLKNINSNIRKAIGKIQAEQDSSKWWAFGGFMFLGAFLYFYLLDIYAYLNSRDTREIFEQYEEEVKEADIRLPWNFPGSNAVNWILAIMYKTYIILKNMGKKMIQSMLHPLLISKRRNLIIILLIIAAFCMFVAKEGSYI